MKHTQRRKGMIALGIVLGVLFVYLGVQWVLCRNAVNDAYNRLENYNAQSIALSYGNMTYVDEGEGEVILYLNQLWEWIQIQSMECFL